MTRKKGIRYHSALEEISARKVYKFFRIDIINISSILYMDVTRAKLIGCTF